MSADLLSNFISMLIGSGYSFLSVRPRLSELRRRALIEPTAECRKNKSCMLARCWRAAGNVLNARAQ